jgi:hypothetical protein
LNNGGKMLLFLIVSISKKFWKKIALFCPDSIFHSLYILKS